MYRVHVYTCDITSGASTFFHTAHISQQSVVRPRLEHCCVGKELTHLLVAMRLLDEQVAVGAMLGMVVGYIVGVAYL